MGNDKVEAAEEVISEVFGDTSVLTSETKERLEGLRDFIQNMIDTLED